MYRIVAYLNGKRLGVVEIKLNEVTAVKIMLSYKKNNPHLIFVIEEQ